MSDPSTLDAGAETRLESRIKKFTPPCIRNVVFAGFVEFSTNSKKRHDPNELRRVST